MKKFGLKSIPKRNEVIKWRELGTDGILLDPRSGDYFEISETGLIIWQHVDGRKTLEEIIKSLATQFDTSDEEVAEDSIEFMEGLISKGLITIGP